MNHLTEVKITQIVVIIMHSTMQIYLPPVLQSSQLLYTLSEIKRKNINNNVLISNCNSK